jgi:hypothetical protein
MSGRPTCERVTFGFGPEVAPGLRPGRSGTRGLALLLLHAGDDPSQPSYFLHQFQHDPVHQHVTLPGSPLDTLQTLLGQVARCHGGGTYVRRRDPVKGEPTSTSAGPHRDVLIKVDYVTIQLRGLRLRSTTHAADRGGHGPGAEPAIP